MNQRNFRKTSHGGTEITEDTEKRKIKKRKTKKRKMKRSSRKGAEAQGAMSDKITKRRYHISRIN